MTDERAVPRGRVRRLQQLARVGARSGLHCLGPGDAAAAARHAAELLGNLRGLAAKVGQMASYVDGFVPDAQSETYQRLLGVLQNSAPASPFIDIRATLELELAGTLAERFASFEANPIASASIGQVHRAVLHDGRVVAVKVQHAAIADALEADLRNVGVIASMASALLPRGVDAEAMYTEIAARFREELDYKLEAERQGIFRSIFARDPRIRVPEVIASHSTRRVLTTAFVSGLGYERAVEQDEALRRSYAETLWRFVFGSMLVQGFFNADPHPGNYLFHEDGAVTFLDYGCVQSVEPVFQHAMRALHQAALENDRARFAEAVRVGLATREGSYEREFTNHLWSCYEPLRVRPYRLDSVYVRGIVREIQELKKQMLRRGANATAMPPGMLLMNRLQFGFYSVLAHLDVAVDYGRVDLEVLHEVRRHDGQVSSRS